MSDEENVTPKEVLFLEHIVRQVLGMKQDEFVNEMHCRTAIHMIKKSAEFINASGPVYQELKMIKQHYEYVSGKEFKDYYPLLNKQLEDLGKAMDLSKNQLHLVREIDALECAIPKLTEIRMEPHSV